LHPKRNNVIIKNFKKKGVTRLKDVLSNERQRSTKPQWISEEI